MKLQRFILVASPLLLAAVALSGCGGGTGNVPVGPARNYVPAPAPSAAPATARFIITVPASPAVRSGVRPRYVSPGTHSVTIVLASIDGVPVSGQTPAVVDVSSGSSSCTASANGRTCTADVPAAVGNDAFTVNTYAASNGTGALLSGGTVTATISASGSSVTISNNVSVTLNPIIAGLSVSVSSQNFHVGVPQKATVTVAATDASGAAIVGNVQLPGPIALTIAGAAPGVFTLSSTSLTSTNQTAALQYDGSANTGTTITVAASIQNAAVSASAAIPVIPAATPTPVPTGGSRRIYVLNAGATGMGATVTAFDIAANGNSAPKSSLTLSASMTAQSIAVDATGRLYVGYAEGEIDTFAPGASGSAQPVARLTGDANSGTTLQPAVLSVDSSGDLVTLGQTNLNNNAGNTAVLVYAPHPSGAPAPIDAWNFNSPFVAIGGAANPSVAGIVRDASGSYYVAGMLQSSSLSSSGGIYVAASSAASAAENPTRLIPGDATTTIPADPTTGSIGGIALDPSGTIYESQFSGSNASALNGVINVFSAGAGGGTTDVAPLRALSGSALTVHTDQGTPALPITIDGSQLFVANGTTNTVLVYPATASGSASPSQTIAGSATQLNAPVAIAVGSAPATAATKRRPAASAAGMSRRFRGAATTTPHYP